MKKRAWKKVLALALAAALLVNVSLPVQAIWGDPVEKGQVFQIHGGFIKQVCVVNGATGQRVYLEEREDIDRVADLLTDFRYETKEAVSSPAPGYEYMLTVTWTEENMDGKNTSAFEFTSGTLTVENVWYGGREGQLDDLIALVTGPEEKLFEDVTASDSGYNAIRWCVENKLFYGVSERYFRPDRPLTRGQAVTVLHRLAGTPEPKKTAWFKDVPAGSYYEKAAAWAGENGIACGVGGGKFSPNSPVTREQFAVMLYNYRNSRFSKESGTADLSHYTDGAKVHGYAKSAMAFVMGPEIMTCKWDAAGKQTVLAPAALLSRGEAAETFRKLAKHLEFLGGAV